MSFNAYSDLVPTQIGRIRVVIESRRVQDPDTLAWVVQPEGRYFFTLVDDDGNESERRSGNLVDVAGPISGTSITVGDLATWISELRVLASGVLP